MEKSFLDLLKKRIQKERPVSVQLIMDQQLNTGGTDVLNLNTNSSTMPTYVSPNASENPQNDTDILTNSSTSSDNKSLINNENINPASSATVPNKMDINQLLSQIMSITSQSLKDAQERLVYAPKL